MTFPKMLISEMYTAGLYTCKFKLYSPANTTRSLGRLKPLIQHRIHQKRGFLTVAEGSPHSSSTHKSAKIKGTLSPCLVCRFLVHLWISTRMGKEGYFHALPPVNIYSRLFHQINLLIPSGWQRLLTVVLHFVRFAGQSVDHELFQKCKYFAIT